MDFPIFNTTPAGTPQIAELHDFRALPGHMVEVCQGALLDAGIKKFGMPTATENGYVLKGDGYLSMQALITSIGGAVIMGAVALYDVEIVATVGEIVDVEGKLLVASTPEVEAVVHGGVLGFEATSADPLEAIQTVRVVVVQL